MHTHKIIDLMNPMEHGPSCGALLVTVPCYKICAHCGFSEMEERFASIICRALTTGSYTGYFP